MGPVLSSKFLAVYHFQALEVHADWIVTDVCIWQYINDVSFETGNPVYIWQILFVLI